MLDGLREMTHLPEWRNLQQPETSRTHLSNPELPVRLVFRKHTMEHSRCSYYHRSPPNLNENHDIISGPGLTAAGYHTESFHVRASPHLHTSDRIFHLLINISGQLDVPVPRLSKYVLTCRVPTQVSPSRAQVSDTT